MTQYSSFYFIPILSEDNQKQIFLEKITKFFEEQVQPKLNLDNYTVDFAFSRKNSRIWVVEINPPPPTSGTILFSWISDKDRNLVQNGPMEFRVVKTPAYDPTENIPPKYVALMKEFRADQKSCIFQ